MNNDLPLGLLPPWASWASEEAYRPADFHTHAGFSLVKNRLHSKTDKCVPTGLLWS